MRPTALVPLAAAVLLALPAFGQEAAREEGGGPSARAAIERGDLAWARRAEGREGDRPQPEPAAEAVEAYEQALEADPADLEARWKLTRALYFQGDYLADGDEEKREIFARSIEVFRGALDQLAPDGDGAALGEASPEEIVDAVGGSAHSAPLFFWGAASWGLWGEAFGRLAAVRKGVGIKVRDYAEVVVALDETYDLAGGYRMLGRLHAVAPKVPFFTGWIDREKAMTYLEKAVELAPESPFNRLFHADALLEYRPERRAEALATLRRLIADPAPQGREVEGARVAIQARELLEKHAGSPSR